MSGNRRLLKDATILFSGTAISQIAGVVRNLVVVLLLNPAQLGLWNFMNVIISYGAQAHLGLLHGMNKAVPLWRGRGEMERAEKSKDSIFWLTLILAVLSTVVIGVVSLLVGTQYKIAYFLVAAIVFLQLINLYFLTLLRADSKFAILSAGLALMAITSAAMISGFAWFSDNRLEAALSGFLLSYFMINVYLFRRSRYRFSIKVDLAAVREALILGFPLILIGTIDIAFLSIDRWMIISLLDESALGYYAVGLLICNALALLPTSVASVLYPKMLEQYGKTADRCSTGGLLSGPLRFVAVGMILAVSFSAIVVPFVIRQVLPDYVPSIPSVQILIFGAFFLSLASLCGNYLISINEQRFIIVFQITAVIVAVIGDLIFIRLGYGIQGVALGTAISYFVYGIGVVIRTSLHIFGGLIKGGRSVLSICSPSILAFILVLNLGKLTTAHVPLGQDFLFTVLDLILLFIVLLPTLWMLNRKSEFGMLIRGLLRTNLGVIRG